MIIGAIMGAVGSLANQGLSIWRENQQAKIDEKKRSDEYEMAKLNASRDMQVASYTHDTSLQEGISNWVADIRALIRPGLTIYLLIIVSIFYFYCTNEDKTVIIASCLDASAMAIAWWFGDRFKK